MEDKQQAQSTEKEGEVVELVREDKNDDDIATVVLFKLDGKEYRVPAKPKPVVALRYLDDVRKRGQDLAAANILATLLGEEAWEALISYEDLTNEQFQTVLNSVHKLVAGSMEGPGQKGFTSGP